MDSLPERSKVYRPLTIRNGVEGKECAVCGVWKVRTAFTKGHYEGLDHRCKTCQKLLRAERGERIVASSSAQDNEVRVDYALMTYEGVPVAFTQDKAAICLTDVYRAAGSPANQEPARWLRTEGAEALIGQYARENNMLPGHIITALRGRGDAGGGTWAPREIALAYAHYLSPALYLACNRFVLNQGQSAQAPSDLRGMLRDAMRDTARDLIDEMRPWWSTVTDIHHRTEVEVRGVVYVCKYPRFAWRDADEFYGMGWERYAIGWTTKLSVEERLKEYPGKYDIEHPEEVYVIKTDNSKLESLLHERRPRQGVQKVQGKKDVFWISPDALALLVQLPEYLAHEHARQRLMNWRLTHKGAELWDV